jgi:hypothetical protein
MIRMAFLELAGANDDHETVTLLHGHYDELLSDFRRRMDTALKALREYEEAVRLGEHLA